ncbi:MAG: aminotransferase class III-fold pyridoxal phosphate-dependent enzyme, partial [Gemmatimonadetes bacterium]|nr:aminotransferase class III-fold pyridoxal phosphate-dependent enzyme [Gemmatimonadota bacterium]
MSAFGKLLPTGFERSERSRDLAERLARVESRNITDLRDVPPFWTRARAANVEDADGNVFLDFGGAFGVSLAGHGHPFVREAIHRQTDLLLHGMGDIHPPRVKVELLEALVDLAPWADSRAILGTSGSDAVEGALKTAQLVTGRPGILAFEGSY